jgi:ankyrin repeat protein
MSHDENMSSSSSSQAPVGAAKQVNRNPLWELAEAIHTDDASNLFTYIERCNAVTKFQPHSEAGSRDSSNKVAQQVGNIYAMLQHKIAATNLQDAILNVAASVNRVAIARAILANNAANGVEWGSRQESALDAACANGHLEVATVIACVEDDQVTLILDQSLALRYHCLAGDIKHVREVLASDSPDVTIKAALLDACRSGRCDIVALLTADARFDPSVDGYEALRLACMQGHVEVVALLLHHLDLSTGAQELNDALTLATDAGQCDVVALLVHDERVNPGLDKSFALEHYCLAGDVTRVKEALDDPDFVTAPLPGALLAGASRNGHAAIVELLLLDPRVDPTADDNAAIQLASECGHDSVVKLLLADPRVDPAADDNSAIRYSSIYGEDSVVKLLLADPRVDPAAHKNFAIQASSGRGHESVVKLLLADPRVDPAAHNNFTIRRASSGGHARVLKLLLADPRVDPTALDNRAIRLATYNGHASVVELLLADPRVDPAADINDAIRHGSANGYASVVKLLLDDPRVDPTAEENFAIREACFAGHASVVKLLLADPRVDPSMGHPTALERASREGHVDIVKMLLEYPKVVVTKAALVDADEGHHDDVIRLLIDKQPQVLHDLFEDTTSCVSSGALENELRHREKASALTLLLAVERLERAVRASDVLRTVIVEYACFDLIDNTADDSSSTTSDDSGASSSSEGSDAEASDVSSDD